MNDPENPKMNSEVGDFILELAKRAGDFLLEHFKQDQDLVNLRSTAKEAATRYDKMVDRLIIDEIKKFYPDHSILSEEGGFSQAGPDWLWVIDSLDGTGNFANQNPFFCVCIALLHKGALVLGAIYGPAINELYFAERGGRAFLNGTRIHVSGIRELRKSYLFYCEGGDTDRKRTGRILSNIYPNVTDIRKLGSAGLEIAWVAAGRAEAYFTTKIDPWDVAPGVLLTSEAGGSVSDFKGGNWRMEKSDLLFSNSQTHSDILDLIRGA